MKPQIFMGPDLNRVFQAAADLGEDVAVVNTRMSTDLSQWKRH